ncbi:venom allergen 5 2 [Bicyclus anynana]|uniref:Venom allergen 5 2 n=1 Tax=Bicyclus anynana TaxID=110368 RepID=A0A6J1NTH4_BICAN|nr:venom allergen 5 2 [Bicyclus anynana]
MGVRVFVFLFLLHVTQSEVLDLTCDQIRAFVDGHNSRRLQLAKGQVPNQPAASEMGIMVWDNELAAKARNWSANYVFKHNPDRTVPSRRFGTGENLYYAGNSRKDWVLKVDSANEAWFNEYKDFKYGPLGAEHFKDPKKPVGHYTQMAWWNSVYLGCAVSTKLEKGMKAYYVVCNYGPSGNYMRQAPYKASGASNKLVCKGVGNCELLYGEICGPYT